VLKIAEATLPRRSVQRSDGVVVVKLHPRKCLGPQSDPLGIPRYRGRDFPKAGDVPTLVATSQCQAVLPIGAEGYEPPEDRVHPGRPDRPAGGDVPELHDVIVARGQDGLAVGTEGHVQDLSLMAERFPDWPAGGEVPDPRGRILAAGHRELAVGA